MHAEGSRHSEASCCEFGAWSVGTSLGRDGSLGSPPSAAAVAQTRSPDCAAVPAAPSQTHL